MNSKLINKIVQKSNDEDLMVFDDVDVFTEVDFWTSTGSPTLDLHLNTFGIPSGIIEVRGGSMSGKTTLSLHLINNLQKDDNAVICILSSERRDNKVYAEQIGIDTRNIIISRVSTIEDVFNKVEQIITTVEEVWQEDEREGKPKFLFVWDSLGATISAQEKKKMKESAEKDSEDSYTAAMGSAARAIKRGLRFMTGQVYDKNITFLVINHVYDKIGSVVGAKESYGGNGIKYHCNMRLEFKSTGDIKIRDEKRGQNGKVKIVKSDFSKTKDEVAIEIGFGLGFILTEDDIKLGIEAGILEKFGKTGASFMKGKLKWKSRPELYQLYEEKNKLLKLLTNKLTKLAHQKVKESRNIIDITNE